MVEPSTRALAATAVLHVAPAHVDVRPGQGSHKDVGGRRAFFVQHCESYRYCSVGGDQPSELDAHLAGWTPTHILIEYSYFPKIAGALRKRFPDARIAMRAHNIEPLQNWAVSPPEQKSLFIPLAKTIYATFRLLYADWLTCRRVDHVYVIAPAEIPAYWRWLCGAKNVSWLPYMPPAPLQRPRGHHARSVIACLPGGTETVRTKDLVNRFMDFAGAARRSGWNDPFVLTGNVDGWKVRTDAAVEIAGFVDDLPAFYEKVAAVAILSPVGYGFKTTIGDALACGAMALLHPKLHGELPPEMKPYAIAVQSLEPAELARVRSRLQGAPSALDAMDAVRTRFEAVMLDFLNPRPKGARTS
ncbi:hypothetical protein GHT07_06045 [Caenimonas koreensis DSM 17982]|uniref:Uncharacterized protein n=1 Tax=Caenimonas koreensis DSM 17982 TaxID=1121255 RepID=A0A844AWU3_9BURK|nr:hypothetical protein [Caenimonas koreensis]MRD46828.1 hypothetical protein [Caenimonas koreensis DSM 17982]